MKTKTNKPDPVSHTIQHKSRAANQAPLSKILQAYKERSALNATVQREAMPEDDELLQGKFETAQLEALEDEEEPLQGKFEVAQREALPEEEEEPLQQKTENKTGLPDDLKSGVEAASGYSMDDVRVHYNSAKPAQLQALAYTQGTEIHVGPGQEKHLPHEAWHVVQQKQGRVKPTVQMQGVQVNDDEGLEREADALDFRSLNISSNDIESESKIENSYRNRNIIVQRTSIWRSKGNILKSVPLSERSKDGKLRKGKIIGGKDNVGSTPGTNYASRVKDFTKSSTEGWLGGHVYKHQWGGGITAGNVVVWPKAVEDKWSNEFEKPIEGIIEEREDNEISIGTAWLTDNELISKDVIINDPQISGCVVPDKKKYLKYCTENERRDVNEALSFIPIVISGCFTNLSSLSDLIPQKKNITIGSGETLVYSAVEKAKKQICTNRIKKFGEDYDKLYKIPKKENNPSVLDMAKEREKRKYKSDWLRQIRDYRLRCREDEQERKGRYGCLTMD